ncbi:MAG: hypothetical protein NZT92_17855 [Abditibacteriales bacterium]|nr:hypothetical protein [Abditibacteriales bacterium]MDW8366413.1 hypothetical protein [Abditibacteriales bacterium]
MSPPSLMDLNGQVHAYLDELMLRHLEQLTALDFAAAQATWQQIKQILSAHSDAEDTTALPFYEQIGEFPEGGKPLLFAAEHQGLHKMVELLSEDFSRLSPDDPQARRQMVLTLDRYVRFRHLFEHHTLREQNLLYPLLESRTDAPAQAAIRDALQKAFQ